MSTYDSLFATYSDLSYSVKKKKKEWCNLTHNVGISQHITPSKWLTELHLEKPHRFCQQNCNFSELILLLEFLYKHGICR